MYYTGILNVNHEYRSENKKKSRSKESKAARKCKSEIVPDHNPPEQERLR
jgi:hypothetical protein